MTTSDAPRIWVVGNLGVGKKSLVAALGGTARHAARDKIDEYVCTRLAGGVSLAVCCDPSVWRGECAHRDVVVLVFDLTDRASFDAIVADWAPLVSAQTRTLLVGTKLDQRDGRCVAASDAMELALVECDDFVEVCASRPPFEGVVYARQLLATWASQESSPILTSPASSKDNKLGVRSSVWLYDPTEEVEVAGHDDVKLRPISRALFEMREAGSDRLKNQERRREQAVAKVVGRSRYHGPTESSRSMRWQAHQQQQNAQLARRRQSLSDVNVESKSFFQPTKLMQHRVDEIRQRLLSNLEKPVARPAKKSSRPRTMSTALPPPAPVKKSPLRPRAPSLSLSLSPSKSPQLRCPSRSPTTTTSDEVALDVLSPPLAPLVAPTPKSPLMANDKEKNQCHTPPAHENQREITMIPETTEDERDGVSTNDIDAMLDYFDGVSLPL